MIVQNLDSGAVLHVDQGKDGDALRAFLLLLRRSNQLHKIAKSILPH